MGRVKRDELLAEATLYRGEAARRLRKRKTYQKRLDAVLALDPKEVAGINNRRELADGEGGVAHGQVFCMTMLGNFDE